MSFIFSHLENKGWIILGKKYFCSKVFRHCCKFRVGFVKKGVVVVVVVLVLVVVVVVVVAFLFGGNKNQTNPTKNWGAVHLR